MDILKEEIMTRGDQRVRVRELADGSREETLVDAIGELGQRLEQQRGDTLQAGQGQGASSSEPSDEWKQKTAHPIGFRDDGTPFSEAEAQALRQLLDAPTKT